MSEMCCANCKNYRCWPIPVFEYPEEGSQDGSRFVGFRLSGTPRCNVTDYGMYIDDPNEPMPNCVMWRNRVAIIQEGGA